MNRRWGYTVLYIAAIATGIIFGSWMFDAIAY